MEEQRFTMLANLAYALQIAVGLVFLFAGATKARDLRAFGEAIVEYRVLPGRIARRAAVPVVTLEIILGLALVTGWLLWLALPIAIATLLAFAVGVAINVRRGRSVPCGCFGTSGELISLRSLARLGLLIVASFSLLGIVASESKLLTVDALIGAGDEAILYAVEVLSVTTFIVVAGLWLLHAREVGWLLVGSRVDRFPTTRGKVEAS